MVLGVARWTSCILLGSLTCPMVHYVPIRSLCLPAQADEGDGLREKWGFVEVGERLEATGCLGVE